MSMSRREKSLAPKNLLIIFFCIAFDDQKLKDIKIRFAILVLTFQYELVIFFFYCVGAGIKKQ